MLQLFCADGRNLTLISFGMDLRLDLGGDSHSCTRMKLTEELWAGATEAGSAVEHEDLREALPHPISAARPNILLLT